MALQLTIESTVEKRGGKGRILDFMVNLASAVEDSDEKSLDLDGLKTVGKAYFAAHNITMSEK